MGGGGEPAARHPRHGVAYFLSTRLLHHHHAVEVGNDQVAGVDGDAAQLYGLADRGRRRVTAGAVARQARCKNLAPWSASAF